MRNSLVGESLGNRYDFDPTYLKTFFSFNKPLTNNFVICVFEPSSREVIAKGKKSTDVSVGYLSDLRKIYKAVGCHQ